MTRLQIETNEDNEATYCPEDDKLRLYVGRVPREEYEFLRAEGWTSTPKQPCDFVAVWNPDREATAIQYAGFIGDEDTPPTERAADRAERFDGYREKRTGEALGHAEQLDGSSLGFQSQAKADREERKLERIATKAGNQWDKAEYWQRRTAGVISHALHKSSPEVRMGRIKEIEAAIRRAEKGRDDYTASRNRWLACSAMEPGEAQDKRAAALAYIENGEYIHPRTGRKSYLYDFARAEEGREADPLNGAELCALYLARHGELAEEGPWLKHYRLRLAYENQMLEAQGSRAAMVEMELGGWIGQHQIHKVTKSPATGRVVSVEIRFKSSVNRWGRAYDDGKEHERCELVNVERLSADAYRAPTDEERAAFNASLEAVNNAKKAASKAKKEAGEDCPLINPTEADAERLQAIWNADSHRRREKPGIICKMTQSQYTAASKGYAVQSATVVICENGTEHRTRYGSNITRFSLFKVRKLRGGLGETDRIIVITDKPQKPLPWDRLEKAQAKCPTVEGIKPRLVELQAALRKYWTTDWTPEEAQLVSDAEYLGLVSVASASQKSFTEKGLALIKEVEA